LDDVDNSVLPDREKEPSMNDDVEEIRRLVHSYAELFDEGLFDEAVSLFKTARVRVSGADQEFHREAARSILTDLVQLHDGIPKTKHVTTNVIVDLHPGAITATARSYYTALQALPNFPLQLILAGRWHDKLEKVDGKWRFSERVIHPDLVGDISRHLKAAP
jgi:hypothetical protein